MNLQRHESQIAKLGEKLGIPMSEASVETLARYCVELISWNRKINLTGQKTAADFIAGPLFDALTLMTVIRDRPRAYVDVGSGGGLPGIPAIVLSNPASATLVEPRGKRATFLRHAVHLLGIDATIREARDDELLREWTDASAQAVFDPKIWVGRGVRLLVPGGCLYVLSAEPIEPGTLPPGTSIDAEFHCVRPTGQVQRYAYRILAAEKEESGTGC